MLFRSYLDKDGKIKFPHQTSWGVSTRLIGAIIMVHGDDNGLVLPPFVAPIQTVIIPIRGQDPIVQEKVAEINNSLKSAGLRVKVDNSDKTPGWKFSEYEMKGVPLRIEVGPRDLANGVVTIAKRNDGSKIQVAIENVKDTVLDLLKTIHEEMYAKALDHLNNNITVAHTFEELQAVVERGGYAKVMWCGEEDCENKVKELTNATSRCIVMNEEHFGEVCPICGKKAKHIVLFAKAY